MATFTTDEALLQIVGDDFSEDDNDDSNEILCDGSDEEFGLVEEVNNHDDMNEIEESEDDVENDMEERDDDYGDEESTDESSDDEDDMRTPNKPTYKKDKKIELV